METTLQRPTRRHRLLRRLGIALLVLVVLLLAAVGFGSNYLVEYAIGRSGDGGNREVALEVEPGGDSVEATIAANKATQETANAAFTAAHPGDNGVGRHVVGDDGTGANHRTVTDSYVFREEAMAAHPDIVTQGDNAGLLAIGPFGTRLQRDIARVLHEVAIVDDGRRSSQAADIVVA